MAGINDGSQAGSRFAAAAQKQRGLLTKDERRALALRKAAAQAQLEVSRLEEKAAEIAKRLADKKAAAAEAQNAFDAAKAGLEAQ